MKKQKPFTQFDPIPVDPKRVFGFANGSLSAHQLSATTGLDHQALCERLIMWVNQGFVVCTRIGTADCSLPVFRLRQVWDK